MRRHEIERALNRWRAAERAVKAGGPGDAELRRERSEAREAFHELAAEHMAALIDEETRNNGRES